MSDANKIAACKDLVVYAIGDEFEDADPTLIGTTPEKIVEYGDVGLWAQHQGSGDKKVNLRMPAILRWLRALAESGTGPAEEYEDVKYKFISTKDSGTTTPVSSL